LNLLALTETYKHIRGVHARPQLLAAGGKLLGRSLILNSGEQFAAGKQIGPAIFLVRFRPTTVASFEPYAMLAFISLRCHRLKPSASIGKSQWNF
jgi:hypothetical protein